MSAPLAYHLTWTTYGTWLPGDERGWLTHGADEIHRGDCDWREQAVRNLKHVSVVLNEQDRQIVRETIVSHCEIRRWTLHALNVRTNHVHLVVTADIMPEKVMDQFKAWCSRRLNERSECRERWWTRHGSTKWINDEAYLSNAIRYVNEGQ